MMFTATRLVPRLCSCCSICRVEPWPMATSTVTEATPISTPSTVSSVRNGWARTLPQAMITPCASFMGSSPAFLPD